MKDIHYYANYADSHDIDCFFRIGDRAFHFASNGQPIPDFILRNKNIEIQNIVYERLEGGQKEFIVHTEAVEELIRKELEGLRNTDNFPEDERYDIESMVSDYAESFVKMARLGFISMDIDEEGHFWIIAEPKDKGKKVLDDILELLPEGRDNVIKNIR